MEFPSTYLLNVAAGGLSLYLEQSLLSLSEESSDEELEDEQEGFGIDFLKRFETLAVTLLYPSWFFSISETGSEEGYPAAIHGSSTSSTSEISHNYFINVHQVVE